MKMGCFRSGKRTSPPRATAVPEPAWVTSSWVAGTEPRAGADTTVAGYFFNRRRQPQFFNPQQICHYAPYPDPMRTSSACRGSRRF